MFEVKFSKSALKELSKLDKNIQVRVISALERIKIRPYPHIKRLVESQYFRLRVGDYRVIMKIENDKLLILIIKVKHRKKVYK